MAYSILDGEGSEAFSISTDAQGRDGLLTVRKVSLSSANTCRLTHTHLLPRDTLLTGLEQTQEAMLELRNHGHPLILQMRAWGSRLHI